MSLKSESVGFKFSVILGDLTRNDPNIEYLSLQVILISINIELPTKWYGTRPCYVTYLILICHFTTCFTKIVHVVWAALG